MTPKDRRFRRTHLTGRAAILAVVVCAIVLSLAYPLREYIAQRGRIAELEAENQQARQQIAALQKQQRRLDDPAYIRQQARERLHFQIPGQTNYIVVDKSGNDRKAESDDPAQARQRPWFVNLWDSVEEANEKGAREP